MMTTACRKHLGANVLLFKLGFPIFWVFVVMNASYPPTFWDSEPKGVQLGWNVLLALWLASSRHSCEEANVYYVALCEHKGKGV